jgi:hypothetical protein
MYWNPAEPVRETVVVAELAVNSIVNGVHVEELLVVEIMNV